MRSLRNKEGSDRDSFTKATQKLTIRFPFPIVQVLTNTALDSFSIPGDAGFPLNQAFEPPSNRQDAETLRQYLSQVRQELAIRLLARLYADGETPSKWWLSFSRRKFMGKSL